MRRAQPKPADAPARPPAELLGAAPAAAEQPPEGAFVSGTTYAASIYGDLATADDMGGTGARAGGGNCRPRHAPAPGDPPLWVTDPQSPATGSPVSNTGDRTYNGQPATTVGLDWLHLSGPSQHLQTVLRICRQVFGLQRDEWADGPGLMFYKDTYRHPLGLVLCYTRDPSERNGQHCTLSIPGTAFPVLGIEHVLVLNTELHGCGFRGTRVDLRMDWHGEGLTLIEEMTAACRAGHLARLRSWEPKEAYGREGRTAYGCNLGKRESPVFYRAYDKGLEQGDRKEGEWVRLELELKGDRAATFMLDLAKMAGSGYFEWDKLTAGVLFGHVDFREGDKQQRISTRRQCGFWRDLVANIETVTYLPERTKTTMDKHWAWLQRCVLPCLDAVMQNAGLDPEQLWDLLSDGLEPMVDAMLRPVVYEYVQHFKLGQTEGPVWYDGRGAA